MDTYHKIKAVPCARYVVQELVRFFSSAPLTASLDELS